MHRYHRIFAGLALLTLVFAPAAGQQAASPRVVPAGAAITVAPAERAQAAPTARGEETRALLLIQDEARRRVAALARERAGLPESPQSRAIDARIEAVKLDAQANLLHAKAAFALRRGDLAGRNAAESALERLLHPRPAVVGPQAALKPADGAGAK